MVLDAYSRRVIGWALDRTLEDDLAIEALKMAFQRRKPSSGLTHHSDRGVQYASDDYTQLLKDHGVRISMSRRGNPCDNAACESFMKTLKYEEVYRQEYRDLADARASIDRFIEKSTMANASTRRWATVRRWSSNNRYGAVNLLRLIEFRWPYEKRGRPQNALDQAWRNLSVRCVVTACKPEPGSRFTAGSGPGCRTRRKKHALPIVRDEFRLAIA